MAIATPKTHRPPGNAGTADSVAVLAGARAMVTLPTLRGEQRKRERMEQRRKQRSEP